MIFKGTVSASTLLASLAMYGFPTIAHAEITSPTILEDYDGLTKGVAVTAVSPSDIFGEKTSLSDGATSFAATDVNLKTNSGLTVSVGRKLSNAGLSLNTWAGTDPAMAVLGRYWVLDIPNMHGVFDRRNGWVVRDREYQGGQFPDSWRGSTQRCSVADYTPPTVPSLDTFAKDYYDPSDYWAGNSISIPGAGEELLLNLAATHTRPNDGLTYYGGTKSNWKVACLSSIRNGAGEGFLVVLPNGQRYTFDWMVTRKSKRIVGVPSENSGGTGIERSEVFLYATRVEDAHGNWLAYEYDAANPHRLLSIRSNDGVQAALRYNPLGKIESISSAGRTWTFEYTRYTRAGVPASEYDYLLSAVVLPDGARWGYQYADNLDIVNADVRSIWQQCTPNVGTMTSASAPGPNDTSWFTVTHPSGAIGEFRFRKLLHGTNRTVGTCVTRSDAPTWLSVRLYGSPMAYTVESLYSKTITGPGVPAQTWGYAYKPAWSWQKDCTAPGTCYVPAETTVTNPDGSVNFYKFSNDYQANPGELIEESVKDAVGNALRITTSNYVESAEGQPFPATNGVVPISISGSKGYLYNRPMRSQQILQDGVTFNRSMELFDAFARPVRTSGYNSLGYSRTETTEYYDHTQKWVLGQVAATGVNGLESGRAVFDPATALPVRTTVFGKFKSAFAYNADGTIASVRDGNDKATLYSSWKRGVPQSIQRPPTAESPTGAVEAAVVDDRGWVTSTTDENGFVTQYSYDPMGRLTGVIYPQGDSVDWYPLIQEFARVPHDEYGLGPNHWRQIATRGNRRTDTYYDAFFRPVLELDFDLSDPSRNIQSQVFTRYDTEGRVAFRSLPTRHVSDFRQDLPGTHYTFDALGRVVTAKQDSELGLLTTTTEYLAGFKRRVTNPRGRSTVEAFQVFDKPDYESPTTIDAPENVRTRIMRDAFGKPLEIERLSTQ